MTNSEYSDLYEAGYSAYRERGEDQDANPYTPYRSAQWSERARRARAWLAGWQKARREVLALVRDVEPENNLPF